MNLRKIYLNNKYILALREIKSCALIQGLKDRSEVDIPKNTIVPIPLIGLVFSAGVR